MANCVELETAGSVTQTSDSSFAPRHVSISNGRPLPSMSTKPRSLPESGNIMSE